MIKAVLRFSGTPASFIANLASKISYQLVAIIGKNIDLDYDLKGT